MAKKERNAVKATTQGNITKKQTREIESGFGNELMKETGSYLKDQLEKYKNMSFVITNNSKK